MPGRVVWKIAAPMVALGAFLLALGIVAAWNVHLHQQETSALIHREVYGMLAVSELHMTMREIRYQLNLFLRTRDPRHLSSVATLHDEADGQLAQARELMRVEPERSLIERTSSGYEGFFRSFQEILLTLPADAPAGIPVELSADQEDALAALTDRILTESVLSPLQDTIRENRDVLERTSEASRATAQHLKIGFLLLGLCGGAAGLLMGTAIARTIGRSIVQLIVSVRGVAGRLSDVCDPVTMSHVGDLMGLESVLRGMEGTIAGVVERLQQRETELLRSEQLAHVGQLAAGMAHELRNPLMPMKVLVQAALEQPDGGGLRGRSLEVVNDEITRLEQAIQSFLDFARPPVPQTMSVDLRSVVTATTDLVSGRAATQGVTIRTDMPEHPACASIDAGQIRQLFLNLLLNALDAQPHGGRIEIAIRGEGVPPADRTAVDWAVSVRDNGQGIPEAMLESMFEPFVTTKETGTGLGLTVSARIAAAHGGSLAVRNVPGSGAEFVLTLPAAA